MKAVSGALQGACVLALFLTPAAFARQSDQDLRKEIEALKRGQLQLQRELQEIRKLLAPRQASPLPGTPSVWNQVFDLGVRPVRGQSTARLTLVEFTDYQCPSCAQYARETYPQLDREYIQTGKIRYAALDLPLEKIHPQAFKAAQAVHCAAEQGKYWEMHERLFRNQDALEPLSPHAMALGLDEVKLNDCIAGERSTTAVRSGMATAAQAGAAATPSFMLAVTHPNEPTKVIGLTLIRGAQPFANFKSAIDNALAYAEARKPAPVK